MKHNGSNSRPAAELVWLLDIDWCVNVYPDSDWGRAHASAETPALITSSPPEYRNICKHLPGGRPYLACSWSFDRRFRICGM
ncbi:hypothetical protein AGOR_G00210690 [Albula goreensis]|uniref:Uncharacterized protein n=1 Tax=Albula goreensis TaxID=1534307 RepID=A0A8T3CU09_9TELE|nr:hypothetical protein AGOR_G00210690 [Albula goreensis]